MNGSVPIPARFVGFISLAATLLVFIAAVRAI
jgi:hypothetical protein